MQTFELTDKQALQRDAAASSATHVLAYGGSRSGKTFGFCRCVALRALSAPGSRHLIARLHNIDVRQSVLMDTWPKMMRLAFPGVPYDVNKSDQYVTIGDDAEVWFLGLDDKERIEKILGKEYATIYPNETSQIAYETVLTLRTRLAQKAYKVNGQQLALKGYYDLNPTVRSHWSYQEFVLGLMPGTEQKLPAGSRAYVQMNPEDNPHLPEGYLQELSNMPERHRQRFRDGNYLSEVPGTLWPLQRLDMVRTDAAPETMGRIVVAVDPSGSDGTGGDRQGILVVGLSYSDGIAYVLEDASCRLSPAGWGNVVANLYDRYSADCVVAEANYGGAMVESTIRTAHPMAKVKLVHASRGKHVRAEPVAALYEEVQDGNGTVTKPSMVRHVGRFPDLEEQMSAFTVNGYQGAGSPDRVDALVWAMTELMLQDQIGQGVFLTSR